ncbi:MAG: phosphate ABC transporter substrate-binding protein, partial [Pseudomonadota bacterium]
MFRVALATLLSSSLFSTALLADEVNISGSTSVARVMEVLADQYNATHKESFVA